MIAVDTPHGPGILGVTGHEIARYHAFTASWCGVQGPNGSGAYFGLGYDTSYNSNDCIRALVQHPDMQWVWIMDDDHTFPATTLMTLLDREVDLLVPLYAQRQPPFRPCIYKEEPMPGWFRPFDWTDLQDKTGLLPVVSAGKGGVLIRRRVIEALSDPWFERLGTRGEDHTFFSKARMAGFPLFCDLDTPLGHMTPMTVRPHRLEDGSWCAAVDMGRGVFVDVHATALDPALSTESSSQPQAVGV